MLAAYSPYIMTCCSALRVYLPVHILPMLAFHWKDLISNPLPLLTKTARATAYSTLFLTSYIFAGKYALCLQRTRLK
jgi:hypothetical protein